MRVRGRELEQRFAAWLPVALVLLGALAYLLWRGRGNTFFFDEWGWIELRRSGLHAILDPYNQHLLVIPLAVYQLLFHTIGIAHYAYYRALAAIAQTACAGTIFVFARRRIGVLAIPVLVPLAIFGAGWEFILWGLNFGFTASIACGVSMLVCLEVPGRRRCVAACALGTVGVLFSETALLFALGAAVELTWRDRGLRRAWVWGSPVLLYAAWWLAFHQPSNVPHRLGAMPGFAAQLAASAAGGMFGLGRPAGWFVLALVGVAVLVGVLRNGMSAQLAGLATTLVVFWALVTYGRAALGDAGASRYIYTGGVLLLLVLVESLRCVRPPARPRVAFALVAALSALALVGGVRALNRGEAGLYTGSQAEAAEIGALGLARDGVPSDLVLDPHWSPQIIAGWYFAAVRALHSTPADPPSEIPRRSEVVRAAADTALVRAGALIVTHRSLGLPVSRCVTALGRGQADTINVALPAGGLAVRAAADAPGAADAVEVRRFAATYDNPPVALVASPRYTVLLARPDADPRPWHVQLSGAQPLRVCALSDRPPAQR